MPLLQFFINENQLTGVEKQELASILTAAYAKSMPEFFVTVVFQELPQGTFFKGSAPADGKFVRFTADHIAVNWHRDTQRSNSYLNRLGGIFIERFEPKGWTWEFHVTESDRDLWRIQSLVPPAIGSEAMKLWSKAGKGVPWDGMEKEKM